MRIAFVIQDLFGRGAEYATALLVRGFVAKGYDVDLVLSQVHADKQSSGLKPFDIPTKTRQIILKSRRARYNIQELRHYFKTTDAEVVIVMSVGYESAVLLASFGLRKRPRLYTVKHTIDFALDSNLRYRQADDSWLRKLKDRVHFSCFDGVLCVAEGVRQSMIRYSHLPAEKTFTVYNPAVDAGFLTKIKGMPTHPWLVKKGIPTFVTAGAFRPEKNHLMVMEAFRRVNKVRAARLVIFGRGELRTEYEKFIAEHNLGECISLPGFTDSLPAEITASDGFISSSNLESFGIALVEGLASGVPVISTDVPCGPREVLKDGEYGELVTPDDPEAMAKTILKLLERERKRAPETAWKRFELPRIVDLYEHACGLIKVAAK